MQPVLHTARTLLLRAMNRDILVTLFVMGMLSGLVFKPDFVVMVVMITFSVIFFLDRAMSAPSLAFLIGSSLVLSFLFIPAYFLSRLG